MAQQQTSCALRALAIEYQKIQEDPVEGFCVKLVNEDNLFKWEVAIFGPPDTLYEGGYFKAHMTFPKDYPYSPPSLRFLNKLWHPNVYDNGDMCISILHDPVRERLSGELPCEMWNPAQSVRTILLSVISLLNEPNISSPANVDASLMFRRWKDSNGKDKEYETTIRNQVSASRLEAEKEGVVVPLTLEDYCARAKSKPSQNTADTTDFCDYSYEYYTDENGEEEEEEDEEDNAEEENKNGEEYGDGEDSGNGES